MGKKNLVTRQTKVLEERRKEANIKNAIKAFEDGRFKSIRKAAEAYHVPYSTLSRRLKGMLSLYGWLLLVLIRTRDYVSI